MSILVNGIIHIDKNKVSRDLFIKMLSRDIVAIHLYRFPAVR
jgi:hypothetical protein